MLKFHDVRLISKRQLTDKAAELCFDIEGLEGFGGFKPGAYINVQTNLDGELVRRSYSISSLPDNKTLSIGVKSMENGRMSRFLVNDFHPHEVIQISPPEGSFGLKLDSGEPTHHIFFGAGSGITPLMSMIRFVLQFYPSDKITLFYGNRHASDIMYAEELAALAESHNQFTLLNILSDRSLEEPIFSGRLDFGKTWSLLSQFAKDELQKQFYLCGPGGMIVSVTNALTDLGYTKDQIHFEYFSAPVETQDAKPEDPTPPAEAFHGLCMVEAELDEETIEFELHTDGDSVLDKAIDEGADPPFSCKGGVCTTCKAKIVDGTVKMDSNYALTDSELKEGYILACQSHPTSAKLKITWDF